LSTFQEPLGGAGRPAKAAATHATRRIGAILLIIVFFSSENPASRERKHPDLSLLLEYERCASDSEFWQRY
jgi:hypothetical protein